MASITITSTPEQDAAVVRYVDQLNRTEPTPGTLTPIQWVKKYINDKLDSLVKQYDTGDTTARVEAYQKATVDEKATIDAILAKYR